jgi:hypothetical protein
VTIELAGELLDKRIQDRHGRCIGTVDSIVLEVDGHGPPTVRAVEVGLPALLRRVHPRLATISQADIDLVADVDAERHSTLLLVEKWLRTHVVEHIPGNGR